MNGINLENQEKLKWILREYTWAKKRYPRVLLIFIFIVIIIIIIIIIIRYDADDDDDEAF